MAEFSENYLKIIPSLHLSADADPVRVSACAAACEDRGADAFLILFETDVAENPENYFRVIRECSRAVDIPIYAHARYFKLEDVKKLLYAGAAYCVFYGTVEDDMRMYSEAMLRFGTDRALLYLFRPEKLARDLRCPVAQKILLEAGYEDLRPGRCMHCLIECLQKQEDFPHEIGLFLSYPPEDVQGFIHNRARNYKRI